MAETRRKRLKMYVESLHAFGNPFKISQTWMSLAGTLRPPKSTVFDAFRRTLPHPLALSSLLWLLFSEKTVDSNNRGSTTSASHWFQKGVGRRNFGTLQLANMIAVVRWNKPSPSHGNEIRSPSFVIAHSSYTDSLSNQQSGCML